MGGWVVVVGDRAGVGDRWFLRAGGRVVGGWVVGGWVGGPTGVEGATQVHVGSIYNVVSKHGAWDMVYRARSVSLYG